MKHPRILFYDLEVSPILGYTFGTYDTNVIHIVEHSYILCFSYYWYGDKKVHHYALPDFKTYKKDKKDDYELVKKLYELLNEAQVVVGHNAKGFDNKVAMARLINHNFRPPSPFKTVDTLTVARSKAKFSSNKLDLLGQQLHLGRKSKETYGDLWQGCLEGDMKSWNKMVKYCDQDVKLLYDLYIRFRPYITNHPNLNAFSGRSFACPVCQSSDLQRRGTVINGSGSYQLYWCKECGSWPRERVADKEIGRPDIVL